MSTDITLKNSVVRNFIFDSDLTTSYIFTSAYSSQFSSENCNTNYVGILKILTTKNLWQIVQRSTTDRFALCIIQQEPKQFKKKKSSDNSGKF